MPTANEVIGRHVTRYFGGHQVFAVDVPVDARDRVPGLEILEVGPGPRTSLNTYVTLGCWAAVRHDGKGAEFVLSAREPDVAHVATLAAVAGRHCGTPQQRLARGSAVPLENPWVSGSACDHLLVTLPYPYGPDLEWCHWRRKAVQLLWLLPITADEAAFVAAEGIEALERRFEESQVHFTDPGRPSAL